MMGIYFEDNDPAGGPWCACDTLCDAANGGEHGRGWCASCEDWATEFNDDWSLLREWNPTRMDWGEWRTP